MFTEVGGEKWSSMGALRSCIGDPDSDKTSDILDAEMASQRGDSQVRLPAELLSDVCTIVSA